MLILIFFGLIQFCTSLNQQSIVAEINNSSETWTATNYENYSTLYLSGPFYEWNETESKKYSLFKEVPQVFDKELPAYFNALEEYPDCVHEVLDQGTCHACWAFASTGSLSDRFCIFSNKTAPTLSPQYLLSCFHAPLGCRLGNEPIRAWHTLVKYGTPTLECIPYVSQNFTVPECPSRCVDGSELVFYKASNFTHAGNYLKPEKHISTLMKEVLRGPIDATFSVYEDFRSYKEGIYHHVTGKFQGLHSVKVIGYGSEKGVDYWLVQNSWGTKWGMNGLFKIKRGSDECGIERDFYAGDPLL